MRHMVTLEDVGDVRHHPADFDDVVFTRLNEHYRPALRLARLVLENLTLQDAFGEVSASSFMLDMNELFERFVTERLRRALRGRLAVKDQHRGHLDEARRVKIQPDLLFGPERSPRFVADIKYKLTDNSADGRNADLYQLLAYTTALDLPEGMLIYCLDAEDTAGGTGSEATFLTNADDLLSPLRVISGERVAVSSVRVRHTGTVLHTYALDLSGTPDEVDENIGALAGWIATRSTAAGSAAMPEARTA